MFVFSGESDTIQPLFCRCVGGRIKKKQNTHDFPQINEGLCRFLFTQQLELCRVEPLLIVRMCLDSVCIGEPRGRDVCRGSGSGVRPNTPPLARRPLMCLRRRGKTRRGGGGRDGGEGGRKNGGKREIKEEEEEEVNAPMCELSSQSDDEEEIKD